MCSSFLFLKGWLIPLLLIWIDYNLFEPFSSFPISVLISSFLLHFSPQWSRLVHGVLAVRTGVSALLPEVWPPASPLPPERRRSALPARPPAHRPAHQWRGEDGAPQPAVDCYLPGENYSNVSMFSGSGWSLFLGSSSSPRTLQESLSKPGSGWEPNTRRTSNSRTIRACPGTHHLFNLPADENKQVTRLCEVHGSSSVSACGLSLGPSSLRPLLRALKLQSSLTQLRLSGNRLDDELLPELVATTVTMPRLQVLDVSACRITAEGLEKAVGALKGQSQSAFPVKSSAGNQFSKVI